MTKKEIILTTPAGRELDKQIAERIFGDKIRGDNWLDQKERCWKDISELPFYSTNIESAWLVVDKVCEIWFMYMTRIPGKSVQPDHRWSIEFWDAEPVICNGVGDVCGEVSYKVNAETAPLAICRAALLTKEESSDS